jgi:RNA polymerase sigma-70 factor (ECF subfamily)
MEQTDRALVALARTGDADAFRALVERHGRSLFRLAFRMTMNEQDAEDIVQETFLRAYRQIAGFDERSSFGTWLYRIAANCSLDSLRMRRRRGEQTAPAADANGEETVTSLPCSRPGPERQALSAEVRRRVAQAMSQLSTAEKTAFILRHFEGMSIEEVSRVLECQPNAAKHSVFRAVQKLRKALEPVVSPAK